MGSSPLAPGDPRGILRLAREDRRAAVDALRATPPEEQVALVCSAPLSARGELLDLLPDPSAGFRCCPRRSCAHREGDRAGDPPILEPPPGAGHASIDLDTWRASDLPGRSD
jgi:hypothetical protein